MKLIPPSAELWPHPDDWRDIVARAARLCYATDAAKTKRSSADMCDFLASRGHNSMFRHGSAYFFLSFNAPTRMPAWIYARLMASPFVAILCSAKKSPSGTPTYQYYVSTNLQYLRENRKASNYLAPYQVSPKQFMAIAAQNAFPRAFNLIRYTVCLTTQIGTSRELNRTSPNSIAEQSTRYVNFGKRGGVAFVIPYWWESAGWFKRLLAKVGWRMSEFFYNLWLRLGFPPEASRGFLMLEAGTRVAYTYNVYEWRRIMALRLTGATGKPHPDAKTAAQLIYDAIIPAMRILDPKADLIDFGE